MGWIDLHAKPDFDWVLSAHEQRERAFYHNMHRYDMCWLIPERLMDDFHHALSASYMVWNTPSGRVEKFMDIPIRWTTSDTPNPPPLQLVVLPTL